MEDEFHYSTDAEWDRAEALQLGEMYPERAWVCTDRDVIHANPFYKGPPVPHPDYEGTTEEWVAEEKAREAQWESERIARNAAFLREHPSGMQPWEETIDPNEIPF